MEQEPKKLGTEKSGRRNVFQFPQLDRQIWRHEACREVSEQFFSLFRIPNDVNQHFCSGH
jgi:hypothetical protein